MKRCLYCYKELTDEEKDFHSRCAKKYLEAPLPLILWWLCISMEAVSKTVFEAFAGFTLGNFLV